MKNLAAKFGRKKSSSIPDLPSSKTPYLNSKKGWNTYVGGIVAQKKVWQFVALVSSAITLISVSGVIYVGSQSKFVPYVVGLPQNSNMPIPIGPATATKIDQVDQKIIQASLNDWVSSARLISSDAAVETKAILRTYAYLASGSAASTKMSEDMKADNRFELAATKMRDIQVTDIIPQSPETWEIDWVETVRSRDGSPMEAPYRMKALVQVTIIPPTRETSEDKIRSNPLGLYITDFSWSKQF